MPRDPGAPPAPGASITSWPSSLLQPVESDITRALTPQEQYRWLHVAGSRHEWRVVYGYSRVAFQTTARRTRCARCGSPICFWNRARCRSGEGAKDAARLRMIPLQTPEVAWALECLIDRARELGASLPVH